MTKPVGRSWRRVQAIGVVAMVTFLLIGLSGLLGRGPFSHRGSESPDHTLRVDYEPVVRNLTPTQLTLRLANPQASPTAVPVFVSGKIAEPLGLDHTVPVAKPERMMPYTQQPSQSSAARTRMAAPASSGAIDSAG